VRLEIHVGDLHAVGLPQHLVHIDSVSEPLSTAWNTGRIHDFSAGESALSNACVARICSRIATAVRYAATFTVSPKTVRVFERTEPKAKPDMKPTG